MEVIILIKIRKIWGSCKTTAFSMYTIIEVLPRESVQSWCQTVVVQRITLVKCGNIVIIIKDFAKFGVFANKNTFCYIFLVSELLINGTA